MSFKLIVPLAVVGLVVSIALPRAADAATSTRIHDAVWVPSNQEMFPGGLYTDPNTDAAASAARLEANGQRESAAEVRQISSQPTAIWLGEWLTGAQLERALARYVADSRRDGKTLVFVTYAVPNRDCGGYSAGGLSPSAYLDWNRTIASSLNGTKSVVVVEPDALSMLTNAVCSGEKDRRPPLISQAVDILSGAGLGVYLDAGNSNWVQPRVMADLLRSAGVDRARGFATNVSNFQRVDRETGYADDVSARLGGKNYVIDVSRNGNGWQGDWCNPSGAALGQSPRVSAGTTKLDALLWVKPPGQSDGTCNGGPAAGQWWESYALNLVRNRR